MASDLQPNPEIQPGEAIYAFMSWLLSQEKPVGPFSRATNPDIATSLCDEFCIVHGLDAPEPGWENKFSFGQRTIEQETQQTSSRSELDPPKDGVFQPLHGIERIAKYFFEVDGQNRLGALLGMVQHVLQSIDPPSELRNNILAEFGLLDQIMKSMVAFMPEVSKIIYDEAARRSALDHQSDPLGISKQEVHTEQQAVVKWISEKWKGHRQLPPGERTCTLCGANSWQPSPLPIYVASKNGLVYSHGFVYISCQVCGNTLLFNRAIMLNPWS